jgi:hypothetical protein
MDGTDGTDGTNGADGADGMSPSFRRLTERLSAASVRRRSEAFRDVDWERPDHQIHADDPRWEAAASWDPLGASAWYRDQSPDRRAAIGLCRQVGILKVGIEFERVLAEGLLRFAARLPNGHPAFRYVYHEITEEAQHSMMFQELIDRSGFDPPGAVDHIQALFRRIADLACELPVLFFLAVLSGEESFDHINRQMLATPSTHPLMAQICRIHVVEEARHVSFARAYVRDAVRRLDPRSLRELRYQAAFVVDFAATRMFDFTDWFRREMGVPDDVHRSIVTSPAAERVRTGSIAGVTALCREVGLHDARLDGVWSRLTATGDETTRRPVDAEEAP